MHSKSDSTTGLGLVAQWLNKLDVRGLLALICFLLIVNLLGSIDIMRTVAVLKQLPGLIDWQAAAELRLNDLELKIAELIKVLKDNQIMFYVEPTTATVAYEAE